MLLNYSISFRKKVQQSPHLNRPPWIVIKNVHVPVHQIDVNVTNPVVEERDTREDRRVLAAVQNDIAAVVIADTMMVIDIMRDTRIGDLIVAETSAEIVMGESLYMCILLYCLTSQHSSSRRSETKTEEQLSQCKQNLNPIPTTI